MTIVHDTISHKVEIFETSGEALVRIGQRHGEVDKTVENAVGIPFCHNSPVQVEQLVNAEDREVEMA